MIRSGHESRLAARAFAMGVALIACAAAGGAGAQSVPDGIAVGPWILAPSFSSEIEIDSNLFRTADNTASERTADLSAELVASLPFKNSGLELGYRASKDYYQEQPFPRTLAQDADVKLELNFSSGDKLVLRDRFRRDYSQLWELEQGAELTFRGVPYNVNRWDIELDREIPGRQGYMMRVRRVDFNHDGDVATGFFDYRGFDTAFEYRQPLGMRWWTVNYRSRRFNDYKSERTEGDVGVPFQKEESDSWETGIRGRVGDGSYYFRVGYMSFRLRQFPQLGETEDPPDEQTHTVAGEAGWRRRLGGRTALDLTYERAILPSTYETYYINDDLIANVERKLLRYAELSLLARLARVRYGNNVEELVGCGQIRIKDFRWQLESRLSWLFHERLAFSMSASHERRSSNCDINNFNATEVGAGVLVGWF